MDRLLQIIFDVEFGYAIIRVTTPLLFATLAALISIKAGVINIAIEGIMLFAALSGVIFSALTGSATIGLFMAVLIGALVGITLAYFSLTLRADIILSAIAINLMAMGGTIFILSVMTGDKGISTSLNSKVLPKVAIPLLENIPVLGPIFSNHNILTYVALLAVPIISIFLYKTPLGTRIRAVGENPDAVSSVGIGVVKMQYFALGLSGVLAGFGGAYMSMGYVSWFSTNMTNGRGFIALAAEAMGGSTPIGSLITSLLFGFFDALSNSIQSLRIPSEFISMIPYLATIIGVVLYTLQRKKKLQRVQLRVSRKEASQGGNNVDSDNH